METIETHGFGDPQFWENHIFICADFVFQGPETTCFYAQGWSKSFC